MARSYIFVLFFCLICWTTARRRTKESSSSSCDTARCDVLFRDGFPEPTLETTSDGVCEETYEFDDGSVVCTRPLDSSNYEDDCECEQLEPEEEEQEEEELEEDCKGRNDCPFPLACRASAEGFPRFCVAGLLPNSKCNKDDECSQQEDSKCVDDKCTGTPIPGAAPLDSQKLPAPVSCPAFGKYSLDAAMIDGFLDELKGDKSDAGTCATWMLTRAKSALNKVISCKLMHMSSTRALYDETGVPQRYLLALDVTGKPGWYAPGGLVHELTHVAVHQTYNTERGSFVDYLSPHAPTKKCVFPKGKEGSCANEDALVLEYCHRVSGYEDVALDRHHNMENLRKVFTSEWESNEEFVTSWEEKNSQFFSTLTNNLAYGWSGGYGCTEYTPVVAGWVTECVSEFKCATNFPRTWEYLGALCQEIQGRDTTPLTPKLPAKVALVEDD
eukprot:gnl/Spiro4/26879_TR13368_c0_g1_i1.p1 gnl/Spiro4/26879_TR13368_c0_g1~~gnl/Spiro4/26879_TR13368_c0_g1_i1.p1  ORF type:complete len:454 (+),score=90.61 gnl/Spiro4/26879_TR13368_c0_g1_i1:36-1364(+)